MEFLHIFAVISPKFESWGFPICRLSVLHLLLVFVNPLAPWQLLNLFLPFHSQQPSSELCDLKTELLQQAPGDPKQFIL